MSLEEMPKGKGNNKQIKQDERKKRKELKKESKSKRNYESSEEKAFADQMRLMDLTIKVMDGDGNCLFRALADQLTGDHKDHENIRRQIIDYIETEKNHFSLFIEDDEPFDDYVKRMREPCEWGGNPELFAASQCFKVNIFVHQVDAPRYILRCESATSDIHLSYHGECHYNSVRSRQDPDHGERPIPIDVNRAIQVAAERMQLAAAPSNPITYWNDSSFDMQHWAPEVAKFVQDSYEVIEDYCEDILDIATALTPIATTASKPMSKKEARKANKEKVKPADTSQQNISKKPEIEEAKLGIQI